MYMYVVWTIFTRIFNTNFPYNLNTSRINISNSSMWTECLNSKSKNLKKEVIIVDLFVEFLQHQHQIYFKFGKAIYYIRWNSILSTYFVIKINFWETHTEFDSSKMICVSFIFNKKWVSNRIFFLCSFCALSLNDALI